MPDSTEYEIRSYQNTPQNQRHIEKRKTEGFEVYMTTDDTVRLRRPKDHDSDTDSDEE